MRQKGRRSNQSSIFLMKEYKPLENLTNDPEELKKIIEELHYKVHSRDVMIDIAEEMFGIKIKKKL